MLRPTLFEQFAYPALRHIQVGQYEAWSEPRIKSRTSAGMGVLYMIRSDGDAGTLRVFRRLLLDAIPVSMKPRACATLVADVARIRHRNLVPAR